MDDDAAPGEASPGQSGSSTPQSSSVKYGNTPLNSNYLQCNSHSQHGSSRSQQGSSRSQHGSRHGSNESLFLLPSEEDEIIESPLDKVHTQGFGKKTIGFWGGLSLLFNSITGPAMVSIPVLYQNAGWVTPTLAILLIAVISGLASTMLCEAMAGVPGNNHFQSRMEMTTLVRFYAGNSRWGRVAYVTTVLLFVICITSVNVSSIIVSAQTMDLAFVAIKASCGLELYPHLQGVCTSDAVNVFGPVVIVSCGFAAIVVLSVPLGIYNLEDNIIVQKLACLFLFVIMGEWTYFFYRVGFTPSNVPAFGTDQTQVLSNIMFNYLFVTYVPSWANEKKPSVGVNSSVWWSTGLSTVLFIFIGVLGALCFHFVGSQNILDVINLAAGDNKALHIISQVSVYAFPIVVLVSSIPVACIIVRYNLLETGLFGRKSANFFALVFPWIVAIPFYTGSGLNEVIRWTSPLVNGPVNFVLPMVLYICSKHEVLHTRRSAEWLALNEHLAVENAHVQEMAMMSQQYHLRYHFSALPERVRPVAIAYVFAIFTSLLLLSVLVLLFVSL